MSKHVRRLPWWINRPRTVARRFEQITNAMRDLDAIAARTSMRDALGRAYQGVTTELHFSPAMPLAVDLIIDDADGHHEWVIDRGLLAAGLRTHAGIADVRVFPGEGQMVGVTLSSFDSICTFYLPRRDVIQFLNRSYERVPAGAEVINFDAELAALLEDGAR